MSRPIRWTGWTGRRGSLIIRPCARGIWENTAATEQNPLSCRGSGGSLNATAAPDGPTKERVPDGRSPRWLAVYGEVPHHLAYPDCSLHDAIMATVRRVPDAWPMTFWAPPPRPRVRPLIEQVADALAALGMGPGDRITIALRSSPQGVIAYYAPTAGRGQRDDSSPLDRAGSRAADHAEPLPVRADPRQPVRPVPGAPGRTPLETLILTRISDPLPPLRSLASGCCRRGRFPPCPRRAGPLVEGPRDASRSVDIPSRARHQRDGRHPLLRRNPRNAEGDHALPPELHRRWDAARRLGTADGWRPDAPALPIFHGFGLGGLINAGFLTGARVILVPRFSADTAAKADPGEPPKSSPVCPPSTTR